ncbi:unnamed protein product [Schistocephalus solidus]|uniref:C2H2-type domain-containing protein n=1 Tax=Schistocephalus solidus TaxID=70667 RepID=A0A183SSH8_SCHSO|nr:unnamed protein product [Schistocephalus solidus]
MKNFFKSIKAIYDPCIKGTAPLLSSDGTKLRTEKSQILERLAEHFRSVLNCSPAISDAAIDRLPQVDTNKDMDLPPFVPETIQAVQQISSGKAPGSDAIPPEVYKHGKIFPRILLNHLNGHIEQGLLPESQCVIRRYRGTTDMIFAATSYKKEDLANDRLAWRRSVQTGSAIYEANRIAAAKAKRARPHPNTHRLVPAPPQPPLPSPSLPLPPPQLAMGMRRAFTHRMGLFAHMRIDDRKIPHNADNTDTPCTPYAPAIHTATATPTTINDLPPASSDFSCPYCARNFTSRIGLVGHLRIHRTEAGEPVWWYAQGQFRSCQPPAPSPISGLLDSVITAVSGGGGGASAVGSAEGYYHFKLIHALVTVPAPPRWTSSDYDGRTVRFEHSVDKYMARAQQTVLRSGTSGRVMRRENGLVVPVPPPSIERPLQRPGRFNTRVTRARNPCGSRTRRLDDAHQRRSIAQLRACPSHVTRCFARCS